MHPTSDLFFLIPSFKVSSWSLMGKEKEESVGKHGTPSSSHVSCSALPNPQLQPVHFFLALPPEIFFSFFLSLSLKKSSFLPYLAKFFFSLHDVRGTGVEEGFACLCIDKPLDPFVPKNIPPRPMGALRALRRSRGSRRDARGNKPGTN